MEKPHPHSAPPAPQLDMKNSSALPPKSSGPGSAVMFSEANELLSGEGNRPRSIKITKRKKTPFMHDLQSAIDSFVEFENANKGATFDTLAEFEKAAAATAAAKHQPSTAKH